MTISRVQAWAIWGLMGTGAAVAQGSPRDGELPATVVTATRTAAERQDVAASVDVVDGVSLRSMGPQVNLSEALQRVPGLVVLNRQNFAQDLQMSSRGFGARSAFGVRGIRLYADGIPATMPDGQGQTALFDLGSAERIEVLRGPASALYGNASGGVVQVFTEDGPPRPEVSAGLALGRDGFQREQLKLGGESGALNYVVNLSHFETDGLREHSAARRDQVNAKLRWTVDDRSTLTFVGSYLNMPQVQDPGGLTAEQVRFDPRQANAGSALAYDTRKAIENAQVGLVYERAMRSDQDTLRLMVYEGTRQVRQYQSIPFMVQGGDTHPGGVIDLARAYRGLDARYTWRDLLLSRPLQITGGWNLDFMKERRQGFRNFVGTPPDVTLGVLGALRRDEDNTARNNDQYMQGQWQLAPRWDLGAGVRHSRVTFKTRDRYIVAGNGDDSGGARFSATTPTLSLMFKASPDWHWYVAAGRSFETPTLNEAAYRSGGQAGLNLDLRSSKAEHLELGVKARPVKALQLTVAAFQVDTDDEIGVDASSGGRTTYRNVGRTRRQGLEASAQWRIDRRWSAYAALNWLDARYEYAFGSGANAAAAGNKLPGVPARTVFAELAWRPSPAWHTALEMRHSARLWANDANTAYAPAYTAWGVRAGWRHAWGAWRLDALVRVDNLSDKAHVGSVIVNEGNARYHEPAPGRALLLSSTLTRSF